jgi:hypothetical protein
MVRLRRARTRIAVLAALASLASLALVAAVTASILHHALDSQTDEGLDTLVEAIGSDIELRGLRDMSQDALRVGLESNVFEFRLEHHSAILFRGNQLLARTGDLPRVVRPAQLADLDRRGSRPFTAVEEFTGQRRICRFQVAHLSGRADGATPSPTAGDPYLVLVLALAVEDAAPGAPAGVTRIELATSWPSLFM